MCRPKKKRKEKMFGTVSCNATASGGAASAMYVRTKTSPNTGNGNLARNGNLTRTESNIVVNSNPVSWIFIQIMCALVFVANPCTP